MCCVATCLQGNMAARGLSTLSFRIFAHERAFVRGRTIRFRRKRFSGFELAWSVCCRMGGSEGARTYREAPAGTGSVSRETSL
jgi:hypothetical protein